MLKLKGIDICYGESRVVHDLNLFVEEGAVTCLVGRNGVGKSTTLKSILGLVKTPAGEMELCGRSLMKLPTYDRVKLGIGYVPQGRDIFPQMTVQENLELGLDAKDKKANVPAYIYELFPALPQFFKRKGGDLSGGQQQQLAIARALVTEPRLLILDEPTEGIQPSIIESIGEAVRRINKEKGITILLVEQYLDFIMEVSDRIYVMDKGHILLSGKTAELSGERIQKAMME